MSRKFWLVRAEEGWGGRLLGLYHGDTAPFLERGAWRSGVRCCFIGHFHPAVCCGFSVEPGECVDVELGLLQRAGVELGLLQRAGVETKP